MEEYGISVSGFRFNKKIELWKVAPTDGNVILQYFEACNKFIPPRKFKIISGENSKWKFDQFIIELQYLAANKTYAPHYLGYIIDIKKTKMTIIPLTTEEIEENNRIGFNLLFKDIGHDDDDTGFIKPIPIRPTENKMMNLNHLVTTD